VRRDRHAVIEEARILQPSLVVVDVLLVERPADALGHAALHLALDIARMDRSPHVLHRGVAQYFDVAGLLIDLDVADVRAEARTPTLLIDGALVPEGTAGLARLRGDRLERQWLEAACVGSCGIGLAVLPLDRVRADLPDHGGALLELFHHVL